MDRFIARFFENDRLDRRLRRHHITAIAFSGTIGIGLFVTSGSLIGLSGSAGCVVSFAIAGLIIVAVMRTLAELVSVRPLSGALIDYPHTFVDPALGFAVGVMYWLAQCMSMAALTAAAARIADNFLPDGQYLKKEQKAAIVIGLVVITLLSNACGVKTYGRLERVVKWFKMLLIIGLCLLMIMINLGFRGEYIGPSNYTQYAIPPYLRWTGFKNEADTQSGNLETGIPGEPGRFLAVWTCITLAMFACMGGDIVIVTAGEAQSPRKDLPVAARFMYLAPISLYVLSSFLVGFNVNYLEPRLFHPFASNNIGTSHSPFLIALRHTTIKILPTVLKACFLFAAYTAANTGLYVASRTLFAISQLYGNSFIKGTLGKTNAGHTPMAAIMFCSLFGLLSFLFLTDKTYNQPILSLSAFFTSTIACIYGSECLAFLRFKAGLTRLQELDIFSRNEPLYRRRHYRAHWQPLCAIFGLFSCSMIVIFSGWPAIYLLASRHIIKPEGSVKQTSSLVADLLGAYIGPILFFALFAIYKLIYRTEFRTPKDFEDDYFLPDFDEEPAGPTHTTWRTWIIEFWSLVR